jgi:hypothetical protein
MLPSRQRTGTSSRSEKSRAPASLGPAASEPRYTTVRLLACEQQIIDGAQRRAGERTAALTPFFVDCVVRQHEPSLNEKQAIVVRTIACSGRGIDAVQALARTGKTTMLAALADSYRQACYRVIGTAPTARATRQLRESAGIPATTMHSLLHEVDEAGGIADRTVLLIDEAEMAPTRLTAALLTHAERAGAKVIAVGDPGQLQSVPAGGWLGALAAQQPYLALREVIRQHDPAERAALAGLHDGHPERYLAHKHDDITVHAHEHDGAQALVEQWVIARAAHSGPGTEPRSREETLLALRRTMRRGEAEPLATQQLRAPWSLGRHHPVARVAREQELDRLALADLQRQLAGGAAKLARPDRAWHQRQMPARGVRLHL